MKRICLTAALAAALLLCAGCAAKTETEPPADANQPSQESALVPAPQEQTAAQETPEPRARTQEAYAAYLDVLTAKREEILGYDWQKGLRYDADIFETVPAGETTGVALADVWGDETPELLFLAAPEQDGLRYVAQLHVYTFDGQIAREILGGVDLDGQVGGGMNYRLFQTSADKGLWIWSMWYSEGWDESLRHYAADGAMEPVLTAGHSGYPVEQGDANWAIEETWQLNDEACDQAAYDAAVPARSEQAAGLLMRNLFYEEYDEDVEPTGEADGFSPSGTAMRCDDAVAYLRGELGIAAEEMDEAAFFAALPSAFSFLSGVGGWSSDLTLRDDGSFTGTYHDSDMGDAGEGYPNGTIYVCSFSGRFGQVRRVDDYTYSMQLLELTSDAAPAEEWIEDGVRYVDAAPYGLNDAREILVYLPGAWMRALPYDFVSWVSMPNAWGVDERPVLLPFWGLYNVEGKQGWFSAESGLN